MALLSPDLLRRLRALELPQRSREPGRALGERRTRRRGQSQEFADHRPYVPGDDLRHLDVHLYSRLDELWVRRFEDEQDRTIILLVDCSASMTGDKHLRARQIAAALGYVALGRSDQVAVAGFDAAMMRVFPARKGRGRAVDVFSSLEELPLGGATDLGRAAAEVPKVRGSAQVVVLSDFLHEDGPAPAVRRLRRRGLGVTCIHLLSPEDLDPPWDGAITVVDRETGDEVPVELDPATRARYRAVAQAFCDSAEAACRSLGADYVRARTDEPLDEVLLGRLRAAGVLG